MASLLGGQNYDHGDKFQAEVTTYIGLIAQNIESDGAIRPLIDHRSSRMGTDNFYSYKAVRLK